MLLRITNSIDARLAPTPIATKRWIEFIDKPRASSVAGMRVESLGGFRYGDRVERLGGFRYGDRVGSLGGFRYGDGASPDEPAAGGA